MGPIFTLPPVSPSGGAPGGSALQLWSSESRIAPLAPATFDPVSGFATRPVSSPTLSDPTRAQAGIADLSRSLPGLVLSGAAPAPSGSRSISGGVEASIGGVSGSTGIGATLEPQALDPDDYASILAWDRAARYLIQSQDTFRELTTPGADAGINWDLVARIAGDVIRTVDELLPALAPTVSGIGYYQGMSKGEIYNGLITLQEFAYSALQSAGAAPAGGIPWWLILAAVAAFYVLD